MAQTPNFGFELIAFDTKPWNAKHHDNWRLADAVLQQYVSITGIVGVWQNATAVTVGQRYVDPDLGTIYNVNTAHTTPSSGSFEDARNATSGQWTSITASFSNRGAFADNTDYAVNDFVTDGANKIGIVLTPFTSAATGDTYALQVTAGTIETLADFSVSITAAAASATAAASSATAAASSATTAAASETAAETAETNAETAETNAESIIATVGFNYNFDSSTTMADPGTGDVRFNNGTVSSVTALAFDATTNDTGNPDVSDYIATWDDSSSTVKGFIVMVKRGTPATFVIFSTSAVADNTGWLQVTVAHVASNGTISNGDDLITNFTRVGDVGDLENVVEDTTPQLGGDLDINGNDITSASNADVDINPNGTGNVVLKTDLVSIGGGSEVGHVSSNSTQDLKLSTNSATNSGTITITDGVNEAITLTPNGTGVVDVQGSMNPSISSTGKAMVLGF